MVTPESLLSTKLHMPQPQFTLIRRSGLSDRLEEATHRALTLISAPAGFGKTILLCEWRLSLIQAKPELEGLTRIAWFALDEEDNDLNRFWLYLVSALQKAGIELEGTVLPLLHLPQPIPIKTILTTLINVLELDQGETILILDDYHLIKAQAVHDSLAYMILHLPKQMHLVISTRTDPPLPLSRLRVQNQLVEIRAADLLFSLSETESFLRETMGISLSPPEIAILNARTEGWAAGLQLAALSMRNHPDLHSYLDRLSGSQRFILDYLVDEVLERLDPEIQSFLEETAVLDRLCASLCDWILNDREAIPANSNRSSASQAVLERLERNNLFLIPLDSERRWYRYHPLFAECLIERLERSEPGRLPELHTRASQWYEKQGLLEEAIRYRIAAQDFESAATLVEKCIPQILDQGRVEQIFRWKEQLPLEIISSRPRLCLLLAFGFAQSGKLEQAESLLQMVESTINVSTESDSQPLGWLLAGIRSTIALNKGDAEKAIEFAQVALAGIPEDEITWHSMFALNKGYADFLLGNIEQAGKELERAFELGIQSGNLQVILSAPTYLMSVLIMQVHFSRVEEVCQRALRIIADKLGSSFVPIPSLSAIYLVLAKVREDWNDLNGSEQLALKAIDLANQSGSLNAILTANIRLASLRASQGRPKEGVRILEDNLALFREERDLMRYTQAEAGLALFWVMAGDLNSAEQWASSLPIEAFSQPGYLGELRGLVLMWLRRAQGRHTEALQINDQLMAAAKAAGRVGRVFEFLVFRSILFKHLGDLRPAFELLLQALLIAEPENIKRTFLNEGVVMEKLLEMAGRRPEISSHPRVVKYIHTLLYEFEKEQWKEQPQEDRSQMRGYLLGSDSTQSPNDRLVEPLTPRELDILRLMSTGASNQEIARELFISLGTVKAHTSHIQGKLGTRNRTETVIRARELGLVDSK